MLRNSTRKFSSGCLLKAAAPPRKAQGFAQRKGSGPAGVTRKKVSPGSLYKNWTDTVHTANLNKNAVSLNLPVMEVRNLDENLNKVTFFSNNSYKALHNLGSFKKSQHNELFPKPVTMVRESTQNFLDKLKNDANKKYILTGEPGVGKSTLLAQVHAYGVESNKVIVNISYPEDFLNGRNDFLFDDKLGLYTQPMYTKQLLKKILKSNKHEILSKINLTRDYKFSSSNAKDVGPNSTVNLKKDQHTLLDLVSVKTTSKSVGAQFQAVMEELTGQEAVGVLFTIDNFSRFLTKSYTDYKDTYNKQIYSLKFQLGKTIMDIISGTTKFKNKSSAFVAAISGVDRTNKTLPVGLGKLEEDPYVTRYHYEKEFSDLMKKGKIQEFEVPKMNKEEVKGLLEFYRDSQILSGRDLENTEFEKLVDEKYFVSGNGNPRELIKSVSLSYR